MVARVLVLCALLVTLVATAGSAAQRVSQPLVVPHGSNPHGFFALDDSTTLFFAFDDASDNHPEEIWRTDGTAAGTVSLGLCPSSCFRDAHFVGRGNGLAFIWASNRQGGYELWSTDGSGPGTLRLTTFGGATAGQSSPGPVTFAWLPSAGKLLFQVDERNGVGLALWASDGTIDGTRRIRLVNAGPPVVAGNAAYFLAGAPAGSTLDLWRTDGTPVGTAPVAGPFQRPVNGVVAAGDRIVLVDTTYAAESQRFTFRVWGSDGTAAGTQVVHEFPDWSGATPGPELGAAGATAFIKLPTYPAAELWRSDGTAAGTTRLPLPAGVGALGLPVLGPAGTFYFGARDAEHGAELWRSDGTATGTALVADLCPGPCDSLIVPAQPSHGRMLFFAGDQLGRYSLYDTDGSAAGTRLLIRSLRGGFVGREVVAGDRVFLPTTSDTEGVELWSADLRSAAAVQLTHFTPSSAINLPLEAAAIGDRVLFAADDGLHGFELWRSDGTPAGTFLLGDLIPDDVPQSAPATPARLTVVATDNAFNVTWDEVPGATGYEVERRTPAGNTVSPGSPGGWMTGFEPGTPITVRVRAVNSAGASPFSDEVSATTTDPEPPARCMPAADALCLGDGRFRVQVRWRNVHAAAGAVAQGAGGVIPAGNGSDVSGYFWFFSPENVELVVKLLDGSSINGFNWFFYGALSDVEYWITVLDTLTQESRTYHNAPGDYCGKADVRSLATSATATASSTAWSGAAFELGAAPTGSQIAAAASGTCVESDTTLCLGDGRFSVQVEWNAPNIGRQGVGHAVPFRDPTGFFWFFDASNTELVVKLLDGRAVNGKYWFFYGALSDVGYTITVTDTRDPTKVRHYVNPPGTLCGRADVDAFASP
ncbi:MAG TPA: hypothetical protein VGS57_13080 [Thermoanaerobaculia bacterium]|jgi:ELWxxDGT repeat protein|nr:hypothetical protein [Thermoanaerobaculia bacterium]